MMFAGVPIAASLGLAGTLAISLGQARHHGLPDQCLCRDRQVPASGHPDVRPGRGHFRPGRCRGRLLRFTEAIIGRGRGSLAVITILVAMIIGGISGSGPACTAAVGGVMLVAMLRAGYPPAFAAAVTAAAGSTDILIPPSVAFIVYSVLVPSATVPALFVGGVIPGILACLLLIIPALFLSFRYNFGGRPEQRAQAEILALPQGCLLGPGRAGAHPGRPAHGMVHPDRGRGDGRGLRPFRRVRDLPLPHPARRCSSC